MAERKTTRRTTTTPQPTPCETCKGAGEVSRTVRVGRKHRVVGQQTGLCLTCLGSGEAPTE
ncbi:hypothetical protein Q2K21_29520 [Streptomyces sp. CGMCC 4.7035]|nr:hypothetical protein [Streptomyces sp. CGMCC 4.7035]WNC01869.1 hypothetical protein Q2K21_29520 [Streptomyces sp. CGMCC 4.7035]